MLTLTLTLQSIIVLLLCARIGSTIRSCLFLDSAYFDVIHRFVFVDAQQLRVVSTHEFAHLGTRKLVDLYLSHLCVCSNGSLFLGDCTILFMSF